MTDRWRWRRKSDNEPMARLVISHYMTREDMVLLLCPSDLFGTEPGVRAILAEVRMVTLAAGVLEPVEQWAWNYSDEEAQARLEWAKKQVAKL
jgi:hypothetical protein